MKNQKITFHGSNMTHVVMFNPVHLSIPSLSYAINDSVVFTKFMVFKRSEIISSNFDVI